MLVAIRSPIRYMEPHSPWTMSPATPFLPTTAPIIPLPSEVIPRLYLSDICTAESAAILSSLGITHVLSAMRGFVALPAELTELQWLQIALDDLPFAELAAHLPATTEFIREALSDPNAKVLVHCHAGVSRSTSVVCAYLIARYGWTAGQAVQYVKMRRSIAEPNFGFVAQLQEYADSIRASR